MYRKLLLASSIHALLGTISFFPSPALSPIEAQVKRFLGKVLNEDVVSDTVDTVWAVVNGAYPVGFLLSAFISGYCTDKFGRRFTLMIINNVTLIVSCLSTFFAVPLEQVWLLVIGRLLGGTSLQASLFLFVYGIECAPVNDRELVVIVIRIGFILWYIFGALIGLPQLLGTIDMWHYIFIIPIVPAVMHMILMPFIPESPKHLYITQKDKAKGEKAIVFYHGPNADLAEIEAHYNEEAAMENTSGLIETLKTRHLRWPFMICFIAGIGSRLGGFDIANFYSTGILLDMGISTHDAPTYNVIILRVAPSLFVLAAFLLIKKVKTRQHLLATLGVSLLSVLLLIIGELAALSIVGVVALVLDLIAWNMGLAFIPQTLPAELCPQVSRSLTTGWQTVAVAVTAVILSVAFPPLMDEIGAWALVPMLIGGIACFIWLFIYLPETRGLTVDQVVSRWMQGESLPLINEPNSSKADGYSPID